MVVQSQEIPRVRLPPTSTAFTLLLGLLVALPSFGIDMSLPALTSVGAALGVAPERAGLMMSLFMLGFAVAPLFYGPVSDRYGRKPVVVFACTLFAIAGIGCAFARSLPTLLVWRVVQGAGAGASMTITLAIVRDLFEGQAARTRLSYVSIATMVVPTIAPSAGAALLALGGWRVRQTIDFCGSPLSINDCTSSIEIGIFLRSRSPPSIPVHLKPCYFWGLAWGPD